MYPIIWHNQNCSTSRKTLDLLESKYDTVFQRNYLTQTPNPTELEDVLKKLNQPATYILRKKDAVYIEKYSDKNLTNEEWIEAMSLHPSMIERPIVIFKESAYLARPFAVFEVIMKAL